jgi:hypothetical protein
MDVDHKSMREPATLKINGALRRTKPAHLSIPLAGLIVAVTEQAGRIIEEHQGTEIQRVLAIETYTNDVIMALNDAVRSAVDIAWATKR